MLATRHPRNKRDLAVRAQSAWIWEYSITAISKTMVTASIWVMLVLTQTPLRRRMPNAKTLVTALKIIIWDGRLTVT